MISFNWQHIQQIFSDVIDLSPEARVRYLDEVCGKEGPLREEVEALLRTLESPLFDAGRSFLSATVTVADRMKYAIVRFARWAGWLYFVERERLDDYMHDYKRRAARNAA